MTKPPLFALTITLLLSVACEDLGDVRETATVSIAAASDNGLSVNGLVAGSFYLTRFRGSRLGTTRGKESLNGLDPSQLLLNQEAAGDLQDTAEGRALLRYIATCALPPELELVVPHDGTESVFPGLLNLAPEWAEGQCDAECQGWMSACLLAHANSRGENVAISLRGHHPALRPTLEEAQDFQFEEGAFYAQLFTDTPTLHACMGADTMSSPLGAVGLTSRLCGRGQCGVDLVGRCDPFAGQQICEGTGPYTSCATELLDPSQRNYQVISVMLEATDSSTPTPSGPPSPPTPPF